MRDSPTETERNAKKARKYAVFGVFPGFLPFGGPSFKICFAFGLFKPFSACFATCAHAVVKGRLFSAFTITQKGPSCKRRHVWQPVTPPDQKKEEPYGNRTPGKRGEAWRAFLSLLGVYADDVLFLREPDRDDDLRRVRVKKRGSLPDGHACGRVVLEVRAVHMGLSADPLAVC